MFEAEKRNQNSVYRERGRDGGEREGGSQMVETDHKRLHNVAVQGCCAAVGTPREASVVQYSSEVFF